MKRHSIAAVSAVLILGATLTAVPAQAAVAPLTIPIDCSLVVDPPTATYSVYTGQAVVLQFSPATCDTWYANGTTPYLPSASLTGLASYTISAVDVPLFFVPGASMDVDRTGSGDYNNIVLTDGGLAPEPAPDTLPNTGVDGTQTSINFGLAAFVTLLGIALSAFARRRLS